MSDEMRPFDPTLAAQNVNRCGVELGFARAAITYADLNHAEPGLYE
jgi:hypothetical protein